MTELDPSAVDPAPGEDSALARVARIAVWAVALGFVMQLLVLAAKTAAGADIPAATFAADVAGGVAWSTIVCAGAAIGVTTMRASAAAAGLIAALFAPIAVAASKAANQMVAAAVSAAGKPAAVSLIGLAATKAVEYGLLGYLLAHLARKGVARPAPYLGSGAAVGLVFGAIALSLKSFAGAGAAELAATAVNELIFPIGCAAVVYGGVAVAQAAGAPTSKD